MVILDQKSNCAGLMLAIRLNNERRAGLKVYTSGHVVQANFEIRENNVSVNASHVYSNRTLNCKIADK